MFPVLWCMSGLFLPWGWERSKQLQTRTLLSNCTLILYSNFSDLLGFQYIKGISRNLTLLFFFFFSWPGSLRYTDGFVFTSSEIRQNQGRVGEGCNLPEATQSLKWLLLQGCSVLFPPCFMRQSVGSFHFHITKQIGIRKQEKVEVKRKQKQKRGGKYQKKKDSCNKKLHASEWSLWPEQKKYSELHLSKNSPTSGCSRCPRFVINAAIRFCWGSRQAKQQIVPENGEL